MQQLLQLIEKFNAGTATEEEKLLLLTALQKQDSAFQQLMQQYYLADLEKKIQELPSGRSGPILEAIKAQIQQRKIYPISIPWYKRSATWAAAAVLVVVAGIG